MEKKGREEKMEHKCNQVSLFSFFASFGLILFSYNPLLCTQAFDIGGFLVTLSASIRNCKIQDGFFGKLLDSAIRYMFKFVALALGYIWFGVWKT